MQLLLDMDKSDMENCKNKIKETHMDDNYYNNKRQKKTGANFEKKKRKNRTCTRPHYKWDQYQYLGNCPPTPPLTQQ